LSLDAATYMAASFGEWPPDYEALRALMVRQTHWTLEYVDTVEMRDLTAMLMAWSAWDRGERERLARDA